MLGYRWLVDRPLRALRRALEIGGLGRRHENERELSPEELEEGGTCPVPFGRAKALRSGPFSS